MLNEGIIFIVILTGVLLGSYCGFSKIDAFQSQRYLEREAKLNKSKKKKMNQKRMSRKTKEKNSEKTNILNERISEYESYASFICNAMGEEEISDFVQRKQREQDSKYKNFQKKTEKLFF